MSLVVGMMSKIIILRLSRIAVPATDIIRYTKLDLHAVGDIVKLRLWAITSPAAVLGWLGLFRIGHRGSGSVKVIREDVGVLAARCSDLLISKEQIGPGNGHLKHCTGIYCIKYSYV